MNMEKNSEKKLHGIEDKSFRINEHQDQHETEKSKIKLTSYDTSFI